MNKITQAALAALVLGVCSTGVYAEDDLAAKGAPTPPPSSSGCDPDCSGQIEIKLEVPKTCSVYVSKKTIELAKKSGTNSWVGSSSYTVTSNSGYTLKITKPTYLVDGANKLPIDVITKNGTSTVGDVTKYNYSATARTFNVDAEVKNVSSTTPAGTYKGTYIADVEL